MSFITRGFSGRGRERDDRLPPGQTLVGDFPVLSAGPTPEARNTFKRRSGWEPQRMYSRTPPPPNCSQRYAKCSRADTMSPHNSETDCLRTNWIKATILLTC